MIAKKGVTFLSKFYSRLQKLGGELTQRRWLVGRFKPNLNRVAWA